jgi:hypothetical protein
VRIPAGEERRREVELEAHVLALEGRGDLLGEVAVRVEARHLVLVLVGHELVQRLGDGLGERAGLAHDPRLGLAHPLHPGAVALGVSRVLVVGEVGGAPRDHLVEGGGELARLGRRLEGGDDAGKPRRIGDGPAA